MAGFGLTTITLSLSLHTTLLLLLLTTAESQSVIKTLPGFDGDLPFKLETGYIGVGKNHEQQMFYYFIESEGDPEKDPLVLSLTGGPGCSSFSSLVFEFGPITFDSSTFGWSLPSLVPNRYSWTKMANIIFLDWPVGAGFSYANTTEGYHTSDSASLKDICLFLRKWLLNHPRFIKNHLYIQGESYGGKIAPMVAWEISKANERGLLPQMSLQGYFIGNPGTYVHGAMNDRLSYAHNLGLISDEYLKYVDLDITNLQCLSALRVINECLDGIDFYQILDPACPKTNLVKRDQTDMYRVISENWANNLIVRNALGVREGTKEEWIRCNESVAIDKDVVSSAEYHLLLTKKGYRGLIYNGDHDMMVPYISTLKWIYSLNLTLDDNWRPWKVNGQVAGFTIRYSDNESYLTFATIKGSGHTPPEYSPKQCFAMISRWLSHDPL
ncbi:hypothetical protein Pfo_002541 [Paulownia fortunei]|nr:hypothetical protein Pfo_002541 [Paulownia fortunei]